MRTQVSVRVATAQRTHRFLDQVAADLAREHVEGVSGEDGQQRGCLPSLRVQTTAGVVEVWDGGEVGEHGVFIQAYEFTEEQQQQVCFVGDAVRVIEGGGVGETVALLRSYLAGPSVAGRAERRELRRRLAKALQVEEGQL